MPMATLAVVVMYLVAPVVRTITTLATGSAITTSTAIPTATPAVKTVEAVTTVEAVEIAAVAVAATDERFTRTPLRLPRFA